LRRLTILQIEVKYGALPSKLFLIFNLYLKKIKIKESRPPLQNFFFNFNLGVAKKYKKRIALSMASYPSLLPCAFSPQGSRKWPV